MANDVQKKKKKVKVVGGGAGAGGEKKAKKRGKRRETYAMYIYKVLKQVGGDVVRHVYPPSKKKMFLNYFSLLLSGPPRHWHLEQSHEHHELLRERPLRAHRHGGVAPGAVQPALNHHQPGGADGREAAAARGAGKARRVRGDQGGH